MPSVTPNGSLLEPSSGTFPLSDMLLAPFPDASNGNSSHVSYNFPLAAAPQLCLSVNATSGCPVWGPYQVIQVQLRSATPTLPAGTSITLTLNSSVSVAGSTSDSCPSTGEERQRTSLHLPSPGSGPNQHLPKPTFTSNSINLCSGNNPVQFLSSCNSRNFPH